MPKAPNQAAELGKPLDVNAHGDANAVEALGKFERSKAGTPFDTITQIKFATSAAATTRKDDLSKREGFVSPEVASESYVTCGDAVSDDQYQQVFSYIKDIFDTF